VQAAEDLGEALGLLDEVLVLDLKLGALVAHVGAELAEADWLVHGAIAVVARGGRALGRGARVG